MHIKRIFIRIFHVLVCCMLCTMSYAMQKNVRVPELLLNYSRDTVFAGLVASALLQDKQAAIETSWILQSTEQGIKEIVQQAQDTSRALAQFVKDPEAFKQHDADTYAFLATLERQGKLPAYRALTERNLPALIKAIHTAEKQIKNKTAELPLVYILQNLQALRFDVAGFENLRAVDGYQELKRLNSTRHEAFNACPSIDELHAMTNKELASLMLTETA